MKLSGWSDRVELQKGKSANLSQFIFQLIIFCHVELLLGGGLVKVLQELSVFSFWVDVILRAGVKTIKCKEKIPCCGYDAQQQQPKMFHILTLIMFYSRKLRGVGLEMIQYLNGEER